MKFVKELLLTMTLLLGSVSSVEAAPNIHALQSDRQMLGNQMIATMILVENKACNIKISVDGETRWQHGCDTTNLTIYKNNEALIQYYNGDKPPYAFGVHIDNVDLDKGISYYSVEEIYAGTGRSKARGKCTGDLNTNGFSCEAHLVDGDKKIDMKMITTGGQKHIINNN